MKEYNKANIPHAKASCKSLKKKYDTLGTETWYEFSRYYPIYTEVKHVKRN